MRVIQLKKGDAVRTDLGIVLRVKNNRMMRESEAWAYPQLQANG